MLKIQCNHVRVLSLQCPLRGWDEFDAFGAELRKLELDRDIILDLGGHFVFSENFGAILALHRRLDAEEKRMVLCRVHPEFAQRLRQYGALKMLNVVATEQDAHAVLAA